MIANIDKEGLKKPIYESVRRTEIRNRGDGPEEACGFFCDNAGFWAGGGGNDWDPGIGCLQDNYDPTSMTGDWQNNWWTSNLNYDYYGEYYYCDFFCGDGVANPGNTTDKEQCDTGLLLDPNEGIIVNRIYHIVIGNSLTVRDSYGQSCTDENQA